MFALVLAALLAAPAPAHADSIVYVHDHNVWAATPDGARRQAITTDGTVNSPYSSPSQARDGTILAQRGLDFHRIAPTGRRLAQFRQGTFPADDADVSPDGTKLAYWTFNVCGFKPCGRTLFSYADRYTPPESLDDGSGDLIEPSWIDDTRVVVANQSNVYIDPVGPPQEQLWFFDPNFSQINDVDVVGNRVALVAGSQWEYLVVYTLSAAPPAPPTRACVYRADPGEGRFDDPTWSPDASTLAFALSDGVHVLGGFRDVSACPAGGTSPVLPGARTPDWGPADLQAPESPPDPPKPPPGPVADVRAPRVDAVLARRMTLRAFTRRGLAVRLTSDEAVRGTLALQFPRTIRRRHRLAAEYTTPFDFEGSARLSARLPRASARRLAKARRARMTVTIVATDRAGNRTRLTTRSVELGR